MYVICVRSLYNKAFTPDTDDFLCVIHVMAGGRPDAPDMTDISHVIPETVARQGSDAPDTSDTLWNECR